MTILVHIIQLSYMAMTTMTVAAQYDYLLVNAVFPRHHANLSNTDKGRYHQIASKKGSNATRDFYIVHIFMKGILCQSLCIIL